ncbi:MAG: DUF2155 domain-containing protein [Alphaproteobacteria bacterium]|nr:DUF2155 domain-containing protein [Alphaproteobacteria bacterium]
MTSHWTVRKTSVVIASVCALFAFDCNARDGQSKLKVAKRSLANIIQSQDFPEEESIWESEPIEISDVNLQILDKISGKVFRGKISKDKKVSFGTISIVLKRCFKNRPEDKKEIYAFLEIEENERVMFANWLFASSPSTNLFCHPTYNVQIEF